MNPKYQVIWTRIAENDLKEIIEYISDDRPQAAFKILKTINDKASNPYTLPERGRIVPELKGQGISQYRELVIPPWRLLYRTMDRKILVLSVIDSRQNVEDVLLKRMINKD